MSLIAWLPLLTLLGGLLILAVGTVMIVRYDPEEGTL